jgi:hypothetical protein
MSLGASAVFCLEPATTAEGSTVPPNIISRHVPTLGATLAALIATGDGRQLGTDTPHHH